LEHRFEDLKEPVGNREKILYLHSSQLGKPWSMERLAEAETMLSSMSGSKDLNGQERDLAVHEIALKTKKHSPGHQLVFSSAKHAEDTFTLMPGSRREADLIDTVKSFVVPVQSFSYWVRNQIFDVDSFDVIARAANIFLGIISLVTTAKTNFDGVDWIQKANSMLPVAFAKLFRGQPNSAAQDAAHACKLLDAVFYATLVPYVRTYPENPFNSPAMKGVKGMQKLAHVTLQRLTFKNKQSQMYFGRCSGSGIGKMEPLKNSQVSDKLVPPHSERWMDSLTSQLEDPLGAAVTLAALLSASKELMTDYATPHFVNRFVDFVARLGPQPRLVQFFQSLCIINGVVIKQNQELVLRECWADPQKRKMLFLDFESVEVSVLPQKPFLSVTNPANGKVVPSRFSKKQMMDFPEKFLGQKYLGLPETPHVGGAASSKWAGVNFKDPRVGSFCPVYVKWQGADNWEGQSTALFYPPSGVSSQGAQGSGSATSDYNETLGYPPVPSFFHNEVPLVRIEALCWVLAPETLCEAITGIGWLRVQKEKEKDPYKQTCFKRQEQLASYFLAELNLFSDMAANRSSNCCAWLRKTFTYEMLMSLSYSPHLPPLIRGAFVKITRKLYIDAYPQELACGRPSLPERLWVNAVEDLSHPDTESLPLIKMGISLDNENALPRFSLNPNHLLFQHEDPHLGFSGHDKFFLCERLAATYLQEFGHGDGTLSHDISSRDGNEMTLSVIDNWVNALVSFGFQSTIEEVELLMQRTIKLLDGRNDIEAYLNVRDKGSEAVGTLRKAFFRIPSMRYETTLSSTSVTQIKTAIISVMMAVADLRANFHLSKILGTFKALCRDESKNHELKKLHCFVKANKIQSYNGNLMKELFDSVEELFVSGDGVRMDFQSLTGGYPVNTVLLDCLMYESDDLFEASLAALERNFKQRANLLAAVADVTLLENEHVPVFGNVSTMMGQVSYLGSLLDSLEEWAVCSSVLGSGFNEDNYSSVMSICEKLQEFLVSDQKGRRRRLSKKDREVEENGNTEDDADFVTDFLNAASAPDVITVTKRSDFRVYDESTFIAKEKFVDRERQVCVDSKLCVYAPELLLSPFASRISFEG
jgi:hypothetical protein